MDNLKYEKNGWKDWPSTETPLSAANLNKMEDGIAKAVGGVNALNTEMQKGFSDSTQKIEKINSDLANLSFGKDATGNWGYKVGGADPVIPFKKGGTLKKIKVGAWNNTYDTSAKPKAAQATVSIKELLPHIYKNLTVDNFLSDVTSIISSSGNQSDARLTWNMALSYESSTGILTLPYRRYVKPSYGSCIVTADVYCIYTE